MDINRNYVTDSLEQHLFFARIMKEHALFIRGLLDPSEEKLIDTADGFAEDYKRLLVGCGIWYVGHIAGIVPQYQMPL